MGGGSRSDIGESGVADEGGAPDDEESGVSEVAAPDDAPSWEPEGGLWCGAVMTITRPGDMDPVSAAVDEAIGWGEDESRRAGTREIRGDAAGGVVVGRDSRDASARIGIACSGGADSIALAHATMRLVGAARVVVIHVDHQLSEGSAAVAEGVASWAHGQGATAIVRAVTVGDRASLEAAARDARYAALADIADELDLSTIFVGHTARDQAETVLMRIVRGTGPAGLAGIPRTRAPRIARPLLDVPREAIEAYVATHALPTWADPMNDDTAIFRVRVRQTLLPALRRENPRIDAALTRLAASATEWLEVIDAIALPLASVPLDCVAIRAQVRGVRKRAIAIALERAGVEYDAVHLDAIDDLVMRPAAGQLAIDLPDARVVRTYDRLELAHALFDESDPTNATDEPSLRGGALVVPDGYTVRRWQPGDRMRPARLKGRSRKLSDLFIDAKVPRGMRSRARVVVRDDGVIVWAEHLGLAHGEAETVAPRPSE